MITLSVRLRDLRTAGLTQPKRASQAFPAFSAFVTNLQPKSDVGALLVFAPMEKITFVGGAVISLNEFCRPPHRESLSQE